MKLIVTTLLILVANAAMAIPKLSCVTGLPTTSFLLIEKENSVELTTIHHNGTQYAPIYNGVVTPSDFNLLKKTADFFEKLGDRFVINFKKEDCRLEEDKFYTCFLNDEFEVAGVKLKNAYFTTSESIDRIPDFEFKNTKVNLYLRLNNVEEYKLSMNYYMDDCKMGNQLLLK